MISNLRAGTPIYVFNKNTMQVVIGKVISVSSQYPQYNFAQNPLLGQNYGVVELIAEIDGKQEAFPRIPVSSSVAEFPEKGMTVSETLDGALNDVRALLNETNMKLEQHPVLTQIAAKCEALLLEHNPEMKKDRERAEELAAFKSQLSTFEQKLDAMVQMMGAARSNA